MEGVRDLVEHGVDLPLAGEHLGEVPHTLSGPHLAKLRFERHEDGVVVEAPGAPPSGHAAMSGSDGIDQPVSGFLSASSPHRGVHQVEELITGPLVRRAVA